MGNASAEYLRNAVLTAPPEQLHLMLYDGAIRFTGQGIEGLRNKNWEKAFVGFSRAQKIMLELLNSLNYEVNRELCSRMAGLYNYIYRHLVQACADRSVTAAEEALKFLQYQRETWLMLIAKLREDCGGGKASATKPVTRRPPQPVEAGEPATCTLSVEG
jgi:flagellar secretion chaperone FliS